MRKRFFIKPKLQLQHLAWTLGVVVIVSVIGYFVFEAIVSAAFAMHSFSLPEWLAIRHALRMGFIVVMLMLLAAVGIENYLLFHSIVGPLYALEKGLRRIAEGNFDEVVRIRETDQLKDLIESFERMKESLRERFLAQEKTARLLELEIDHMLTSPSLENLPALRAKLQEIKHKAEKKAA